MRQNQQGSASVVTLMLVLLSVFLLHLCAAVGTGVAERARVQAVADLVALHAADYLRWNTAVGAAPGQESQLEACAAAASLAQLHAVELRTCEVLVSRVFSVQVAVAGAKNSLTGTPQSQARAGPQN